jgi:hypothetical protein
MMQPCPWSNLNPNVGSERELLNPKFPNRQKIELRDSARGRGRFNGDVSAVQIAGELANARGALGSGLRDVSR